MIRFLQMSPHLCLIWVYLEAHSLSGVNVYLKSHKGKFSCHPFNIFMPGSCGANSPEQIKEGWPYGALLQKHTAHPLKTPDETALFCITIH